MGLEEVNGIYRQITPHVKLSGTRFCSAMMHAACITRRPVRSSLTSLHEMPTGMGRLQNRMQCPRRAPSQPKDQMKRTVVYM